jgi:hypothetical protein
VFHVSRLRRVIVLAAVIVWAALSTLAKEEAKGELERLYDEFNQITLDTSKGFAVKDFLLEHDSFSAKLEDGVLFFSNKIGDQLYVAVFLGRGKMTIDIPEPVKAMQFRNILWKRESKDPSKKGVKDQPFVEAFLVVPQDIYELLSGEQKVPGSEVAAVTEEKLLEKYREEAKELFNLQAIPLDWQEIFADWRKLLVRSIVWHHLNNFPNEYFEFMADTKDFRWVRFRFNPDLERECLAGGTYREWASRIMVFREVRWDRREDYRQDEGGWTANLRKRLHEDRRTIEIFHYDMDITIHKAELLLENKMTMRIRPRKEGVRCARFDFLSHLEDDAHKTFIIKKCTDAEGTPLQFFHDRDELLVDLGKPMEMGKDYSITAEYEAKFIRSLVSVRPSWFDPIEWRRFLVEFNTGVYSGYTRWHYGPDNTFLLPTPYPWYPQVGGVQNEATYDVKVRVPSRYIIAASGRTMKRWEDSDYKYLHTRVDKPANNFDVVFGKYYVRFGKLYDVEENTEMEESAEKWGNPTIHVYGLQQQDLTNKLSQARSILQFYNWFFQTPFPYDELDVVPMVSRATPGLVLGEILDHHLAHQWWPGVTGMRNYSQDAWLSEGFAEYSEALSWEFSKEQEEEGSGFKALCERAETWLEDLGDAGSERYDQASFCSPWESASRFARGYLHRKCYEVQVYLIHMLRNILGPELFRTLLQRFLKDFAGKQPVTPDFIDTVRAVIGERVTGEPFRAYLESKTPITEWSQAHRDEFLRLRDFYKNLDDWFEDWYIDPGHAKIRFSWSAQKDASSYVFTGRIRQDPEEFKMVLAPIILRFTEGSTFVQRFVDKPDYTFQLRLPGEPTEVVLDESKTLAAEVTVEEE